ncbi:MAG: TetR/AcrR family transcriptional regulator [Spirochaetes bacterium]|nr:TetR/AcrR family transcriptional regulator [Spirochaetota bacterium]MBX3723675.1 TetR/AcrR family transcriptional regulator [Turneriella sp.]
MEEKVAKREREGAILRAAKKIFAEQGYHEASIDDIIKEADIARGTFYLYYSGKRTIFAAILNLTLEEVNRNIAAISLDSGAPSPVDQVKANVRRVFNLLIADRHIADILFVRALGIDAEAMETLNAFYKKTADLLARALTQGMTIGLLNKCDPQIAAYSIIGSVKEVFLQVILAGEPSPQKIDAVIDEIIRVNLYGFYTRGGLI